MTEARTAGERLARALDHLELHHRGGPHLDRGHAHLAVALGEVAVAHREQRALDRHRELERRPLGDLLDVHVAAVLARWDRAQAVGGRRALAGHRAGGVGRHHQAAAAQQCLLALGPRGHLLARGCEADHAHERGARDAHARQLPGGRPAVGDLPVHQVGHRVEVAQEAEPRHDAGERVGLGQDVDELDLEEIARARSLHQHRPGDRVDRTRVHTGHARGGGRRPELSVHAIAGLEHDLLPLVGLEDRGDVGMPAVVAGLGLVDESLAPVDLDALHGTLLRRPRRGRRATAPPPARSRDRGR